MYKVFRRWCPSLLIKPNVASGIQSCCSSSSGKNIKKSKIKMLFVIVLACLSAAPFIAAAPVVSYNLVPPSIAAPVFHTGVIAATQPEIPPAHPAVVENAIAESQLPQELLNPFYKNPAIAAGLAKESWFTDKEFPVHHREAEKIPREQIFKLVNNIRSTK